MKTVLVGIPCLLVGGTEIQTLRLVEALVSGGYRVVTVCYFEFDTGMVEQYRRAGSIVECLSPEGIRPQGSKATYLFLHKGLKHIVKAYHPDVAHIQYMAPGALPIIILKQLGVSKVLATSHTMADIYRRLFVPRLLQRLLLTAFTCITETAERSFFHSSLVYSDSVSLKRHNHFTLPNSLPPNYPITPRAVDCRRCRIGFVGRLERIKGADLILPAFALLQKQYPHATLTITGDGKLMPLMLQQQEELSLPVEWKGRQPQEALVAIYQDIDILWMPSRSEGFGLTAIEAMANGCLVVAADTGGLPEIIGHPSLLCRPDNAQSLADTTLRLLSALPDVEPTAIAQHYQFEQYQATILSLYSKIFHD